MGAASAPTATAGSAYFDGLWGGCPRQPNLVPAGEDSGFRASASRRIGEPSPITLKKDAEGAA